MSLEFRVNLKPPEIRCLECERTFPTWLLIVLHWKKAWRRPEIWGKHEKPRTRSYCE